MDWKTLLADLQPALIDGISVLLGALLLWLANAIRQKTGLDIEARHREALHSALVSGIRAGLRDGPDAARAVLVERAIAYARESVPDAIRRLAPSSVVLQQLAEAKLSDVLNGR